MTDSISRPTDPQPANSTPVPPRKRRRWLRRLVLLVLLLVVGLVALVALGPTLASMSPVRNLVLSQANQHMLDGKIQVTDWSFGWLGKQKLSGIKVYDDKQSLVAEVAQVTVDKSLASLIADPFNLGTIRIERPNLNVRHHPDGSLNVARVTKPKMEEASDSASAGSPIEIPSIAGQIEIVDGIVTHSGAPGLPAVLLARINGNITMPGGDAPIQNKLDLIASVDDGAGGTVSVAGDLKLFNNGKLTIDASGQPDLSTVAGTQVLTYDGVDLSALRALLGEQAPIDTINGKAAGTFTATITGGREIAINGKTNIVGLAAAGPILKGDTFASESTEVLVPSVRVSMPNGLLNYQTSRVRIGESAEQPVTLLLQQGKATVFADAPVAAILNVIDGKAPGEPGTAIIDANFDIGQLAANLRNTFKLVEGIELTGGQLASRSVADVTPMAISLASTTSLDGIAGRDTNQNRPIALQSIKIDLAATVGGSANLLASVRDVKFELTSAFANGSFTGPSLAGINGTLTGALDRVQAELGQVIDFGTLRLTGAFNVTIASQGDLTTASTTPVVLTGELTISDVRVAGLADRDTIEQKQIVGKLVAEVSTDAETNLPKAVNITTATLQTGDAHAASIAADATASIMVNGEMIDVPAFAVRQFSLDLPRLANELGSLFPELKEASDAVGGTVTATLTGSVMGVTGDAKVAVNDLVARHSGGLFATNASVVVTKTGERIDVSAFEVKQFELDLAKAGQAIAALLPEQAQAAKALEGNFSATFAGSASNLTAEPSVTLQSLQAQQSQGMFRVSANGPLTAALPKDAALPQATGTLAISADLAQLNAATRRAFAKQLAIETSSGDVKSGQIEGTLVLSRPDDNRTGVQADFVASNLAVGTPSGVQNFQPIKLALKAAAADDLSNATIETASAEGELLSARAANTKLTLRDPAKPDAPLDPMKLIESADVSLAIPNLAPLYSIATAFLPPAEPATDGTPVAPLKVVSGSFSTKAQVSRAVNGLPTMNVSELRGGQLAVQKGDSILELASFNGTQTITPIGDALSLKGNLPLKGLKVTEAGQPAFSEDQIDIGNDLLIDLTKSDAVLNAVTLKMDSSGALAVTAKGAVRDYMNARRFDNIVADVAYDLEPLWLLAKPLVPVDLKPTLANLKPSGKVERRFTVSGQYPTNLPFHEAIKQVVATGSLAVPVAELEGSRLANLDVSFRLAEGLAAIGMQPAEFNDGTLDFDGAVIDFTDPLAPRLSVPADKKLVQGATLNPFLATNVLGKFVNPVFANPSKASGQLTAIIIRLDRVPLDPELIKSKAPENDGVAEIEFEVPGLILGNETISKVLEATGNSPTINGAVRKSRVQLARGVTKSDITIAVEQGGRQYPLRLNGAVSLSDMKLMPMNLSLLTEFLQGRGGDLAKYMPAEVTLPITGTTLSPQVQVDRLIGKLIEGAIQKQLTERLLGGGRSDKAGNEKATPSEPETPRDADQPPATIEDAVGDLFKELGKKKKK
ncbi:MAG TPA: hypothetical protein VGN72_07390 [Tepidisphaeraceae bacterium]|jgi:hypothetical protein|nr:hypothetical protein [Tepidisphaeraceae bacterium]